MYQTQPLGYAASPVRSLFSSLISHRLSTNHFINEDQFWLSARGTSNESRLLLIIEGNLLHVTMLFVQCSLLLLLLTTMLVLCTAVYLSLQARCANTPEGCSNQQATFSDMALQASVTCILFHLQIDNSLDFVHA